MRKSHKFRPALTDQLEDRTVPSHLSGGFLPRHFQNFHAGFGRGGPGFQGTNLPGLSGQGGIKLPGSSSSSNLLAQDARQVQQAFQTLNASVLGAISTLRLTAAATAGPTQAGLDAYNTAIGTAINNLNATITSTLSNLPSTGIALTATLTGYTATLQSELQSAGSGLANSTNQAVLSLKQESTSYTRSTLNQSTMAILNAQPAGAISSSTLRTYKQAVDTVSRTLKTSISNAVQGATSAGTSLISTAVSAAVSSLQDSLDSAINGLGSDFTSSTYNPTAVVHSQLATMQDQLLAITAPTAGSRFSARLFARTVNSVIAQNLGAINQTVLTAVQSYNNSLL